MGMGVSASSGVQHGGAQWRPPALSACPALTLGIEGQGNLFCVVEKLRKMSSLGIRVGSS